MNHQISPGNRTALPDTLPAFLWHFAKNYKGTLLALVLIAFYWGCFMSLNPYAMKLIIDAVVTAGPAGENLLSQVMRPALFYVALSGSLGIVFRAYDWIVLRSLPQMEVEITAAMFAYVEGHSYAYFQEHYAGSLANKINDMTKSAVVLMTRGIEIYFARAFTLSVGIITMYLVNPCFALLLATWAIVFILVSGLLLLAKRSLNYAEEFSESRSTVVGRIVDSITNVLTVKLFAQEGNENRQLHSYLDQVVSKERRFQWYMLKVKALQSIFITSLIAGMVYLLIRARSQQLVTVGDFALILGLSLAIVDELFTVAQETVRFASEIGTCRQALSIVMVPHDLFDAVGAKPLQVQHGQIAFERVHFRYTTEQEIFTDRSVHIPAGQKVGLVGSSGSGKTTFVHLILRFFDVETGRILIDGQDIRSVTQQSLHQQIAMIPQEPVLFHRTLLENIRYGRLDATEQEVIECARRANCHEFIMQLKDGYHSLVGERGVKLSGGQRQRIAIARALLKNAPILILDEATSSLDSVTEAEIQQSLGDLMAGRTTLVIAHRLSTLFHMDRLLVFYEGHIVEDGTHESLLQNGGHYAQLWKMQSCGFLGRS